MRSRIQPHKFNLYAKGGKTLADEMTLDEYRDRLYYQKSSWHEALNHLQDMINMYFDILRRQEDVMDLDIGPSDGVYDDIDDVIMIEI